MEQKREFPTAAALVFARVGKRLAAERGDLGLARAARRLEREAKDALAKRQSVLSDPKDHG